MAGEEDQAETIHHRRTTTTRSLQQGVRVLQLGRKLGDRAFGQAHLVGQLLATWPGTDLRPRGIKDCGAMKVGFGTTMTMARAARVWVEGLDHLDLLLRPFRPPDMRVLASARRAEGEAGTPRLIFLI